jgi:enoyl-CoA hydratase/carnithine racemase
MNVEREDGLLVITSAGNSLPARMLREALETAGRDADVRTVLLEVPGPVFCAEVETGSEDDSLLTVASGLSVPFVIAVQGAVLGTGLGLVACAHVAVAAQGTSFGLTEMREGRFPCYFDILARAIGQRRALELALTSRVFSAPEALQYGLIHHVAPAFEYDDRALAIARALAKADRRGVEAAMTFARAVLAE